MAGFMSKLFGRDKARNEATAATLSTPDSSTDRSANLVPVSYRHDLEVMGESHYRGGVERIFLALGRPEGGVTNQPASLLPEPKNEYDLHAVQVVIMGEKVGYIPREDSQTFAKLCAGVGRKNVAVAPARIWAINDDGVWRSRVTLTFEGSRESEKDFAAARLLAEAAEAEREEARARAQAKKDHKEAGRTAGSVDGQHWTLLKPSISELKRQARFDEALTLLEQCVYAAEREGTVMGATPAPWPTEQVSVVLRKTRDYHRELEFLERYALACGDRSLHDGISSRLQRARLAAGGPSVDSAPPGPEA